MGKTLISFLLLCLTTFTVMAGEVTDNFRYDLDVTLRYLSVSQPSGWFTEPESLKGGELIDGIVRLSTEYAPTDNIRVTGIFDNNHEPINHLSASYTHHLPHSNNIEFTVGTIDQLGGFFAAKSQVDVTGMMIKPQGIYRHDFIEGGLGTTTGAEIAYSTTFDHKVSARLRGSYGKPYVESVRHLEGAMFDYEDELVDINLKEAWNVMLNVDILDKVELLVSKYYAEADVFMNGNYTDEELLAYYANVPEPLIPAYLYTVEPEYRMTVNRYGLKVRPDIDYCIIYEQYDMQVENDLYDIAPSSGMYIMGTYYFNDKVSGFIGHTMAETSTGSSESSDNFFGAAYDYRNVSIVVDVHMLEGDSWVNDIENHDILSRKWYASTKWYAIGTSINYRF